jgi:glyoxylase-like metal-dependent hydrolase (beta-lactamase superfamily II)
MLWSSTPAAVDMPVDDGDVLQILGGIEVLHAPGHTPGSICLYLKQEKVVIVGDALVNRFGLGLPSRLFTIDIPRAIQSIKRLAGLDFEIMCFGHGAPLVRGGPNAVSEFAGKVERKYCRTSQIT